MGDKPDYCFTSKHGSVAFFTVYFSFGVKLYGGLGGGKMAKLQFVSSFV